MVQIAGGRLLQQNDRQLDSGAEFIYSGTNAKTGRFIYPNITYRRLDKKKA